MVRFSSDYLTECLSQTEDLSLFNVALEKHQEALAQQIIGTIKHWMNESEK